MRTDRASAFTLVDAHVHYYPCYRRDAFLDGALRNVRQAAAELGLSGSTAGALMLTEAGGARWFRRWQDDPKPEGSWRLEPTGEPESLLARRATGERLILVSGRQIAAREGLEVLALGRDLDLADGLPLEDTLERVRESGALPVLPWGFGKWWGRRGERVAGALRDLHGRELFLGDSAGRLQPGIPPRLFQQARELGVLLLAGTDPLPLPRHTGRAGSYGFMLPGALDERRPAEGLLRRIRETGQPQTFGRRAGPVRFLRDQTAMRLRRRDGEPTGSAHRQAEVVP